MSVEDLHKDCTPVVGAVTMESSDVSDIIKDASPSSESPKPQPMAFMIHFTGNKDAALSKLQENFSKYAKANAVQAVGLSPLPMRKCFAARRAGYHSEGYFSSDQEEDFRGRSDFFVKKFKNLEKGLRMTNLAQEKKIMADQNKALNSAHTDSWEFGDFPEEDVLQNTACNEAGVDSKRHNTSMNNLSTLKPEGTVTRENWLVLGATDEEEIETQDMMDELNDLDLDGRIDSSSETLSEAGTYTIDKEAPCPDVEQARLEIEKVIERKLDTGNGSHAICDTQEENDFTMSSLYRDGSNWINEWATQVVKHNHHSNVEEPCPEGLPPLPLGKVQAGHPSPLVLTRIPSPVLSPEVPHLAGRRLYSSPQHTTCRNMHSPLNSLPMQEVGDGHSDSSLETESFLRATESVVTAMQARMSFSLDSGGESDVDTSHSYQAPPSSTPAGGGGDKHLTFRRPSATAQSDSSSDTGCGGTSSKAKHKDVPAPAVPASAPQMRYNRAFSLRRARLDTEDQSAAAGDSRRKKSDAVSSIVTNPANKAKKTLEPPKSIQTKNAVKGKSPKPEAFSRTDCGRFSVRAPKNTPQSSHTPKPAGSMKKGVGKKPGGAGGRSNSTLSSREVEFQNWKRRKSYDPMKAAAEGKKKEAAKKATMSSSMTQSSIMPSEVSPPSMQNPVLRSASFHGTAGLTPKYISSEEEDETLSADESSPTLGQPPLLAMPLSPSKREERYLTFTRARGNYMVPLEGAFGGSRASLYSNASNSSLRGRNKLEALDSLVMAAVCSLSNKLCGSSCNLLKKLRYLYEEDSERADKLSAVIEVLQNSATPSSPQTKSPSKEISGTLKNLKRMENVFRVLDEVLFDEEDFDLELEDYQKSAGITLPIRSVVFPLDINKLSWIFHR
ncbi:uncharacterized protein LOC110835863 isoform X4 [Zootermopsis nevadensis]|uniref:uncharacterized protein LOC110835863 isoform X4 n=1 Tax=Zootermopsis nevadensis TaxID=136037 RepID=UPI000B8EAACD|nr:uncharacterized protein LOC110835863 isoform X4 [Zootermopsis nevadensis]